MSMDRIFSGAGRPGGESAGNGRRYGVDMAKVTNIDDPEKLNRVKCKRITSDPDVGETDWMYVCSPLAGTNYGLYMMPKVGDLVLLSYLGGDVHRPFVIGSLWTKDVAAPYKIEGGKNETFSFRLPSGTEVVFSEASGKKILVTDKDGKNALTMDLGSGAVTVQADKKLTLSAGTNASITLDGASGKITVSGKTGVDIQTAQLKAEASGTCQIKANGQMSVESSGMTQIKGSMLKLN